MKKYFAFCFIAVMLLIVLSACGCEHEWLDADCVTPKTCSICQETDGEPLGHTWADATCTAAKTCSLCAATDGDPLPHTPGDVEINTDYVRAITTETQTCTECNTVLNSEETVISLVGEEYFHLSPEEFVARLNYIYESCGKTNWTAKLTVESVENQDFFMGIITCEGVIYARLWFSTKEDDPATKQQVTSLTEKEKGDRIVSKMQITIYYSEIADQLYDFSNLTVSEASDHVSALHGDEDLFADILTPIILTYGSALDEAEADAFIRAAYQRTSNYFDYENIIYADECGDFYTEFINLLLANLSYTINISTSPEYWMKTN